MNLDQNLLNDLFDSLNSKEYNYCMLRGYEKLPFINNDIDFAVSEKHLSDAENLITSILSKYHYKQVKRLDKFGILQLYFFNTNEKTFLHIDLKYKFVYRGIEYLGVEDLLKDRILYKNIYIPSPEWETATILLKEILYKNKLDRTKYSNVKKGANDQLDKILSDRFSKSDGKKLRSFLLSDDENYKNSKFKYLKLVGQNFLKKGPLVFTDFIKYISKEIKLFISPPGKMLVLIGPDGSGKTTVFNLIKENFLKNYFSEVKYYHFRYEIIPPLAAFIPGKQKANVERAKVEEENPKVSRTQRKKGSLYWIYPYYYYFDYLLGTLTMRFHKYRNRAVVFDRYYLDYIINDEYYSLPRVLRYVYRKTISRPDHLIYLEADAQAIFDRKPELTVEEILHQQDNIKRKILNSDKYCSDQKMVRTDSTVEKTSDDLYDAIL